jgi:O-antigen/teichoic acid export membrane protein
LGIYALANNIAGPIESLIINTCHMVLYPRCAHDFRTDPGTLLRNYYTGNIKLFASILLLPAGVGGAAFLIVSVLYDPRYWHAAAVLQAFMLRATLAAFAASAEALLIAAGEPKVILVGNVFRTLWIVPACLGGYYLFGFTGFVYGAAANALPALVYYFWLQKRKGLLIVKYETYKVLFALAVALGAHALAGAVSALSSIVRIRL